MLSILTRACLRNVRFVNINRVLKCSTSKSDKSLDEILGSISTKYQVFRNEDSSIILDVNEESFKAIATPETEVEIDQFEGINLERGVSGVYDVEDLVEVLRRETAQNLFVASVPSSLKYVDYICVVSGRSYRHMLAIAQFVRRVYKIKRNPNDILPKIEGENSREWIAMDLGNIALHIFSHEARIKYDLDSLWSLGEEYDDECNKPDDPIVQMLQQHSVYLRDLEPKN